MIEIHAQPIVTDFLDDFREEAEQALFAGVLVVERRQHQNAAAAEIDGMLSQNGGVADRARACARHQLRRLDAGIDQLFEHFHPLIETERVGLTGGAERRQTGAAFLHQPFSVLDETIRIGCAVFAKRRQNRRDDAGEVRGSLHCMVPCAIKIFELFPADLLGLSGHWNCRLRDRHVIALLDCRALSNGAIPAQHIREFVEVDILPLEPRGPGPDRDIGD